MTTSTGTDTGTKQKHFGRVLALLFLALNAYAVLAWLHPDSLHSLRVVLGAGSRAKAVAVFEPSQAAWKSVSTTPLHLVFDRDIEAPIDPATGLLSGAIPQIEPELVGEWGIESPRVLRFTPHSPWRAASRYRVRIAYGLEDLDGLPVTPGIVAFETPGPALLGATPIDYRAGKARIRLQFSQAVESREVLARLTAVENGMPRKLRALENSRAALHSFEIEVETAVPRAGEEAPEAIALELRLAAGVVGLAGPVPGASQRTRLDLSTMPRVTDCEGNEEGDGEMRIAVSFSVPVDEVADAHHHITIQPEMPFRCVGTWRGLELVGEFLPGAVYSLNFARGLPLSHGRALVRDEARIVRMPDRAERLRFRGRGSLLSGTGRRALDLEVVNTGEVTLEAFKLFPNNIVPWLQRRSQDSFRRHLGRPAGNTRIHPAIERNTAARIEVPLDSWVTGATGEALRGTYLIRASARSWYAGDARVVTISELGITCKRSPRDLLVWVTSTSDGRALEGVEVRVLSTRNQELLCGLTDPQGRLHFSDFQSDPHDPPLVVTAQRGADLAYLECAGSDPMIPSGHSGRAWPGGDDAFLFCDRGVTRPGETIRVGGWLRDPLGTLTAVYPIELRATRPDRRVVWNRILQPGASGWFETEVPIASSAHSGRWSLDAILPGSDTVIGSTQFLVEEFRPDRLRVVAELSRSELGPEDELQLEIAAEHTSGDPAAGLRARIRVGLRPHTFAPAGFEEFAFLSPPAVEIPTAFDLPEAVLDERGKARVDLTLGDLELPQIPLILEAAVSVLEPGGRAVSSTARSVLHPRPWYAGVRVAAPARPARGESLELELIAIGHSGEPAAVESLQVCVEAVEVRWALKSDERGDARYVRVEDCLEQMSAVVPMRAGAGRLRIPGEHVAGHLRITARGAGGCRARLEFHPGGVASASAPDRIAMRASAERVRPGEELRIVVRSPFAGLGLLTVEQDRVLASRLVEVPEGELEIPLTIEAGHAPCLHVSMTVVRPVVAGRERFRAAGRLAVIVTPATAPGGLTLHAPERARPGEVIEIHVRAGSPASRSAPHEVVCYAVDDAVLALTGYQTPDPQGHFHALRRAAVEHRDAFGRILPEPGRGDATMRDRSGGGDPRGLYAGLLRKPEREAVHAIWLGRHELDERGEARLQLPLPRFQGRLRLMVLGADRESFASAEQVVNVRRPFTLNASLPAFLAPGDLVEVPLLLRCSEEPAAGEVELALAVEGPLQLETPSVLKGQLALGEQRTWWARARVLDREGSARLLVDVRCGSATGRSEYRVVVRHAAPPVTRCGQLLVRGSTRIELPQDLEPVAAGCRIEASCAPWSGLETALDDLIGYPYGCLEQTISRAFPMLAIEELGARGVVDKRFAEGARPYVNAAIEKLASFRLAGDGLALWPDLARAYPWGSLYALHFAMLAAERGYTVPEELLAMLKRYGRRRAALAADDLERCYALYLLARGGAPDTGWTERMFARRSELAEEARYFLAGALHFTGREDARLALPSGIPAPRGVIERGGALRSDVRLLAIALDVTRELVPESPRVPELTLQLCRYLRSGRLGSTQATAFALFALARAIEHREESEGAELTLRQADGRETKLAIPARGVIALDVLDAASTGVALEHTGAPVYISWVLRGHPRSAEVVEFDRGLSIRRTWRRPDGSALEGGVRRGDLVLVELVVEAEEIVENCAWIDVLPAGFAIENPRLASRSGQLDQGAEEDLYPAERVERLADRLLLFGTVPAKRSVYRYLVRAIAPGRFAAPAVEVICLYDERVRSLSGAGRVEVLR